MYFKISLPNDRTKKKMASVAKSLPITLTELYAGPCHKYLADNKLSMTQFMEYHVLQGLKYCGNGKNTGTSIFSFFHDVF